MEYPPVKQLCEGNKAGMSRNSWPTYIGVILGIGHEIKWVKQM